MALITGRGALERRPGLKGALAYHALSTLYRWALRRPDVVLFQNEDDREFFLSRFRLGSGAEVDVIPGSGVNLDRFPFFFIVTAEGKDLFHQAVRTLTGFDNRLDIFIQLSLFWSFTKRQL